MSVTPLRLGPRLTPEVREGSRVPGLVEGQACPGPKPSGPEALALLDQARQLQSAFDTGP